MNTLTEEWRKIPGYDGYEASSLGNIRSYRPRWSKSTTPHLLKLSKNSGSGRLQVSVAGRSRQVHFFIALAFQGPRPAGLEVNHKDGDKLNNRPSNLEYITRSENIKHAYKHKLIPRMSGTSNGRAKLEESQIHEIRESTTRATYLAKKLGVSIGLVSHIRSGMIWGSLPKRNLKSAEYKKEKL